jgi:hypothetical protein
MVPNCLEATDETVAIHNAAARQTVIAEARRPSGALVYDPVGAPGTPAPRQFEAVQANDGISLSKSTLVDR